MRIWVKHSVYTHFPKDRNCEICKRTKITRAPCRRRNGETVPRAVNFGDLITADHKVLSDICESRNNHRYAVMVQDLATEWIQAYPCKIQNFTRNTREACKSSWNPRGILKSFTLTIPWNSEKLVKISPGIICTSTPHRFGNKWDYWESSAQSERRYVCCIVATGSKWKLVGRILWNVTPICETFTDLLSEGKTPYERRFGQPFKGPIHSVIWFIGWVLTLFSAKDQSRINQFGKQVLPGLFLSIRFVRGCEFERTT